MSFRTKVVGSSLLVLVICVGTFSWWAVGRVTAEIHALVISDLERELEVLAPMIDPADPELDGFIDGIGARSGFRVTVVDRTGRVVADSDFSGDGLKGLANHLDRPEVAQAFRSGFGRTSRFSASKSEDLFYVALRLPDGSGVLRFAKRPEETDRVASLISRAILVASTLVLVGGGLATWLFSRRITAGILLLSEAARRISRGEFIADLPISSSDEVGNLARDMEDLSHRMKTQLDLLESERDHLSAVLDSMTEGVLVTDIHNRIVGSNPALREMLQLSVEPEGRMVLEVIRNADVNSVIQSVLGRKEAREMEIHHGGRVLVARLAPIGKNGNSSGVVTVFSDITDLRRLESLQKDFISNVSHELKTPLTSIQGYAETLLGEDSLEPVYRRFAEKIYRNASQLSTMIGELFSLARLERSHQRLQLERVRFVELVREVEDDLDDQLQEKGLNFEVLDRTADGEFECAPGYLRRVFRNLIENSIKYTGDGGIHVSMEEGRDEFLFCVRDTGSGVSEEHLERIFERFYRVDKDRSRKTGGTGIGLAIVKHIVELHGGRVWAESRLGKGTAVHFTIPRERRDKEKDAHGPASADSEDGNPKKESPDRT